MRQKGGRNGFHLNRVQPPLTTEDPPSRRLRHVRIALDCAVVNVMRAKASKALRLSEIFRMNTSTQACTETLLATEALPTLIRVYGAACRPPSYFLFLLTPGFHHYEGFRNTTHRTAIPPVCRRHLRTCGKTQDGSKQGSRIRSARILL